MKKKGRQKARAQGSEKEGKVVKEGKD